MRCPHPVTETRKRRGCPRSPVSGQGSWEAESAEAQLIGSWRCGGRGAHFHLECGSCSTKCQLLIHQDHTRGFKEVPGLQLEAVTPTCPHVGHRRPGRPGPHRLGLDLGGGPAPVLPALGPLVRRWKRLEHTPSALVSGPFVHARVISSRSKWQSDGPIKGALPGQTAVLRGPEA